MSYQLNEESFLKDVAEHQMIVIRDDGVNRHIRFKQPGTGCMHFDLITWPGQLCYTGDMGTFVFQRLEDMFEFFRTDRKHMRLRDGETLAINPSYWGEKLNAVDRSDGYEKFSMDIFRAAVKETFERYTEMTDSELEDFDEAERERLAQQKAELWSTVEQCVYNAEDQFEAVSAIRDWHQDDLFADFWDRDMMEYSHRFIWCCYALAWGIKKYDEAKAGQVAA
jgi:hypothetical protein